MIIDTSSDIACLVCEGRGWLRPSGGSVTINCPECPAGDPEDEYDGVFAGYEQRIGARFVELKNEIDALKRQVALLQMALLSEATS